MLAALVSLAACGTLLKPKEPSRDFLFKSSGSVFTASNGYVFAVLPEPTSRVVRLDVRYPVGWAQDPAGKEGLAHLVEHLLTEVEFPLEDGTLTSIGAETGRHAHYNNAFTAADSTQYVAQAPADKLDELMQLEAVRVLVGCQGISPELFAREKEIVKNEMRQRQGAGGASLLRDLRQALYPAGHPYARASSVESVSRIELADVCSFLAGEYTRGPAMVIASGAVTVEGLRSAAAKSFARIRPRGPAIAPPPLAEPRPGLVEIAGDVEEPMLLATWPLPPMSSPDYEILRHETSAIARRWGAFGFVYEWGHSATTMIFGGHHAPYLAVGITLRSKDDRDEAIDMLEQSVDRVLEWIDDDEADSQDWLDHSARRTRSVVSRYESLSGRADLYADFLQFNDYEGRFVIGLLEALQGAGPGQTSQVASRYLDPDRVRFVYVEPDPAAGSVALGGGFTGGATSHGIRVDPAEADRPLEVPLDTGLDLDTIRYTTDSGLDVLLWPHGGLPIVHGRLVVDSGTAHDPRGQEGLAALQYAGADHDDHIVYYASNLSSFFDRTLRRLAIQLRSPGYELSDKERESMQARLRQARAAERRRYRLGFIEALYGKDHPYARMSMTEKSLEDIGTDRIMDWGRKHVVPANSTLILAGQFDAALAREHIAYETDHVSSGKDSAPIDARPKSHLQPSFVAGSSRPSDPQVEISVGFLGARGVGQNYGLRLVLASILSAKLDELRSERALSYGFYASYTPRVAGGLWLIRGLADKARAAEAARLLQKILAEMRADPESYRLEFALARRKVVESLLGSSGDATAIADRLVMMARFDLSDGYYDRLVTTVASSTLADVASILDHELAAPNAVFGVYGPETAVATALAAAREPVVLAPKTPAPSATPGETPSETPGETPGATPGETPSATPTETPSAELPAQGTAPGAGS